jgi:hypothetical protein
MVCQLRQLFRPARLRCVAANLAFYIGTGGKNLLRNCFAASLEEKSALMKLLRHRAVEQKTL